MAKASRAEILTRGTYSDGRQLTATDRENLLAPYLPSKTKSTSPSPSPSRSTTTNIQSSKQAKRPRRKPMRTFAKKQLYLFLHTLVHFIFSVYRRFRKAFHAVLDKVLGILYYHHRTPEYIQKDIKHLKKLPEHLSVILDLRNDDHGGAGLEGLVNDVSEIASWCACAGIPFLSVYEKTGILKRYIPQTHRSISQNLESYLGSHRKPTLSLRVPNQPTYSPPNTPPSQDHEDAFADSSDPITSHLKILLLSAEDGRSTLVDLTKTLADMAQRQKLAPGDISAELIDAEIRESVMSDPDLLVLFGPRVDLQGYPPWQVRLTEISHVRDNEGVSYQVFLRALYRFAKAEMRFGR